MAVGRWTPLVSCPPSHQILATPLKHSYQIQCQRQDISSHIQTDHPVCSEYCNTLTVISGLELNVLIQSINQSITNLKHAICKPR